MGMDLFKTKRDALFACLDDASREIQGTVLDQRGAESHTINALKRSHDAVSLQRSAGGRPLSHLRGKESIFKKPEMPIARCLKPRQAPDYQVNPHKWMKYSLSDVDISDHTNTAAAFTFLKEIDDQREDEEGSPEKSTGEEGAKIEFKKSSKIRRTLRAVAEDELLDFEVDRPKMRGSRLIMPEYVIGAKPPPALKQKKTKAATRGGTTNVVERAAGSLMLAHLTQDEEPDDNEDAH